MTDEADADVLRQAAEAIQSAEWSDANQKVFVRNLAEYLDRKEAPTWLRSGARRYLTISRRGALAEQQAREKFLRLVNQAAAKIAKHQNAR